MSAALPALILAFALGGLAPAAAQAEPVPTAEARAVRSVIEGQLAAFAADDAKQAFERAAPAIQKMFGDADTFLAMVRAGYPMVYRPASVAFLAPTWVEGTLVQRVHMTDARGTLWLAVYQLEQQPDRSWRIGGCSVQPASGKLT